MTREMIYPVVYALRGSINKWLMIVLGCEKDEGSVNCPLCRYFTDDKGKVQCTSGCPVADDTNDVACYGSPYDDIRWDGTEEELDEDCTAQLEYLRGLLRDQINWSKVVAGSWVKVMTKFGYLEGIVTKTNHVNGLLQRVVFVTEEGNVCQCSPAYIEALSEGGKPQTN